MTSNMKTFFQNSFLRIQVSLNTRRLIINGVLQQSAQNGFYCLFKIAKEFYYSAFPVHLKNIFNQIQESIENEIFDSLVFWREMEEFPCRQIITAPQNSCRAVLQIALPNAKERRQILTRNINAQLIFSNFNNQKRFQTTENYKQF